MTTPYIGFGNETLNKQRIVKPGDLIRCPSCKATHPLTTADDGNDFLLFYKCGNASYLGAIAGRCIVDIPADVKGTIP